MSRAVLDAHNGSVSVVVPLLNEAETLDHLIASIVHILEGEDLPFEVLLVDDGSTDGTWQAICDASAVDARVVGLSLSRNFGKDAAIFAGLREASGDAVIVMDGDLQHPTSVIPELITRWRSGAQVVEGVKRTRAGQPFAVRFGARTFNRAFSRSTGVDLTDATDLRLLSRAAVEALLELPEHAVFFRGTSTWIGFRREQVEFDVEPRPHGTSRFSVLALARFAVRSLTAFTSAPLHLVTLLGVAFALFSVALGSHTLISWMRGVAVEGFTTVILLLLIQGSAILLGLGVIGEYLARIHDEVKARPRFIVEARTASRHPGGEGRVVHERTAQPVGEP